MNSTGVLSRRVHLTRVLAGYVLHALSRQGNAYSGSPGVQSELMKCVSHSLCRNAHSSSIPELVIQGRSVLEPPTSRLNQQKIALTLC